MSTIGVPISPRIDLAWFQRSAPLLPNDADGSDVSKFVETREVHRASLLLNIATVG